MSIRTKLPRARASATSDSRFAAADLVAELEPEARELHGDVRVEPLALDPLERPEVGGGDPAGLLGARDLLAEHVDGGELALRVQPADDPHRVVERRLRRCRAPPSLRTIGRGTAGRTREIVESRRVTGRACRSGMFAHEALAGCAHERDRLGEEHAHRVA